MDNLTQEKMNLLCDTIDRLLSRKSQVLMAIEGPCTAGKTTLSQFLKNKYACTVIPMDQFFLRPEQRTPDRLAQPGGNVDYERFYQEVLQPLQAGKSFSYRPFSCSTQTLTAPVEVVPERLTIIEGTYSVHPYFCDPYDLRIFLTIDPDTQRIRIGQRPVWKQERFFNEWIPMETFYFNYFSIKDTCDLIL